MKEETRSSLYPHQDTFDELSHALAVSCHNHSVKRVSRGFCGLCSQYHSLMVSTKNALCKRSLQIPLFPFKVNHIQYKWLKALKDLFHLSYIQWQVSVWHVIRFILGHWRLPGRTDYWVGSSSPFFLVCMCVLGRWGGVGGGRSCVQASFHPKSTHSVKSVIWIRFDFGFM